jgi:hypothetical protein
MPCHTQLYKDIVSDKGSNASTDLPDIFSNDPSDASSDSELEPDMEPDGDDSDDDSDGELLFDDEKQYPPEYYQAESDSLDVSRLRQKRYSDKTQAKLNETMDYWDR